MTTIKSKLKKKFILYFFLAIIAVVGIPYGIKSYLYSHHHEETDNAQLEGNISPIIPKVAGYITDLMIEDNKRVKKGDTLFKIDERDLHNRVTLAEAAYNNALASLEVMRSNLSSAYANTDITNANVASSDAAIQSAEVRVWKANQDFERYSNLLSDNAATQQQFDEAKAEKDGALAELTLLKMKLLTAEKQTRASQTESVSSTKQIGVAQAIVEQRKADLEFARLQLSYTVVTAPTDGVVSKKSIQVGQYVNAGQALFSIVANDDLWVVANFKETQLAKMKVGDEVDIVVDALNDQPLKGVVTSFSRATGAKFSLLPPDNATGNFVKVVQRVPVKILIAGKSGVLEKLSAGMSVKVAVAVKS
jgi:membrane fusion protein (multidrug efflux system)